jgi:hypothetical protein
MFLDAFLIISCWKLHLFMPRLVKELIQVFGITHVPHMILLQLTYACFRFVYNWWLKTCLGVHDYQWEYLYIDGWLAYLKLMVWRNCGIWLQLTVWVLFKPNVRWFHSSCVLLQNYDVFAVYGSLHHNLVLYFVDD